VLKPVSSSLDRLIIFNRSDKVSQSPMVDETIRNSLDYVYYDTDNLFPQKLIGYADNSATLLSAIQTRIKYTAGNGFRWDVLKPNGDNDTQKEDQLSNIFGEMLGDVSASDFLHAVAFDRNMFTGMALQIPYNREGLPAGIIHTDLSAIRSGKMSDGAVNTYWYSDDWGRATGKRTFNASEEWFKP